MKRSNPAAMKTVRMLIVAVAILALPAPARADLLDEEEPVAKEPSKPQSAPPTPKPLPSTKEPSKGGKSDSPGQTVLAPKGSKKKSKTPTKSEPVHFESKGLRGLREKGTVELVDQVVITQGDMRLEADHAQVYFDETAKDVMQVVADGNVKIFNVDPNTGEKLRVFAEQGTFLNSQRLITVQGNVRLWRGSDSVVRMKKATYEMDTGWIKGDRVAGELSPSEKDDNK